MLTIENSQFDHNLASLDGGAVRLKLDYGDVTTQDKLVITGSSFSNNYAGYDSPFGNGGALSVSSNYFGSQPGRAVTISASHFEGNEAHAGGAIYTGGNSRLDFSLVQGSTISGNTATGDMPTSGSGGGLYLAPSKVRLLTLKTRPSRTTIVFWEVVGEFMPI